MAFGSVICYKLFVVGLICGYGLVVEHVLAKDETGVRFSLPAQLKVFVNSQDSNNQYSLKALKKIKETQSLL